MIDTNVQHYSDTLKTLGIEHTLLEHPQLISVFEVQKFLGFEMDDAGATLLMKTDDAFVAIIRRGDTKLEHAKVKTLLGTTSLRMATDEEFAAITGVPSGAASVIIPTIKTYIDEKVFEKEFINAGSGSLLVTVRYRSEDLKKIPGVHVVDICTLNKHSKTEEYSKGDIKGKRFLSGITPSGDGSLHIGNYLGAVKQFIELSKMNETFLMVADLHGLTTIQDKKQLAHNIETLVLEELSLLLGFLGEEAFSKIIFFRQSDVTMHTELQSILNNVTPLGLLKRAHAYKDKLAKDVMEDDVNLGLFNYPILMASDILLYKPDLVPVGKDQKQHIEITRDIAERMNRVYKKQLLKLPEPYIPESVAIVLGTDGKRKMSKSLGNLISIFEDESVIKKQVNGVYTDPTRKHATDPGHIEGNMVFSYLDFFGDATKVEEMKTEYKDGRVSDVAVKEYLHECLMKTFAPARKAYAELKANPKRIKDILKAGQEKALSVAVNTMKDVRDAIGISTSYSFFEYPRSVSEKVTIDDFAKLDLTVGRVVSASHKEGSDKLIRLVVDIGETETRIIFTGVRSFGYTHEDFSGKQFFFITNLAPRKMLDEYSEGMILAVDGADGRPQFISAEGMSIGATIR